MTFMRLVDSSNVVMLVAFRVHHSRSLLYSFNLGCLDISCLGVDLVDNGVLNVHTVDQKGYERGNREEEKTDILPILWRASQCANIRPI